MIIDVENEGKFALAICSATNEYFVVYVKEADKLVRFFQNKFGLSARTLVFMPGSSSFGVKCIRAIKITNGVKSNDDYVAVPAALLGEPQREKYPAKYFYSMNSYHSLPEVISAVRRRMASVHHNPSQAHHEVMHKVRIRQSEKIATRRAVLLKEMKHIKSIGSLSSGDETKRMMVLRNNLRLLKLELYRGCRGELSPHYQSGIP